MKLVDALTLILKDLGIEFVFGVSGANIEHFHDAIYRLGNGNLTAILAKSESSAAFMADGLARAHNTLGVCCSTSGGGMTNLAVGIAESYADGVPVLAIVGQIPTVLEGKGGFQDSSGKNGTLNALQFWKSITKYTAIINDPAMFWECFETAIQQIFTKRLGPAALLIPRDLFESEVPERPKDISTSLSTYRKISIPDKNDITALLDAIDNAKHPVIIVGSGVRYTSSINHLKCLINQFNIPVVTTFADVNAFPHDDPHYLGMIGVAGYPSAHDYIKNNIDLVIAIGEEFSAMVKTPIESILTTVKIICIGPDISRAQSSLNIQQLIEEDIETFLSAVIVEANKKNFQKRFNNINIPKKRYMPFVIQSKSKRKSKTFLTSQAITILQKYLHHSENILFDAGNCVASAIHYFSFPRGAKTIISLGMGGMGYAIPAGIGTQLGSSKNKKSLVITGDGGFLISGFEIHTAIEYQLPILFIVFNNNMHGMCVTRQQRYFSNRITASCYKKIDIAKIAKGFGNNKQLWVASATDPNELECQLTNYYKSFSTITGVLELKINPDEVPPFIPFLGDNPDVIDFI